MRKNNIQEFKNSAEDTLNDLSGKLAAILKSADKARRSKLLDIETDEEKVRERITQLDNITENKWNDVKNEIKDSLEKIKSDIESIQL